MYPGLDRMVAKILQEISQECVSSFCMVIVRLTSRNLQGMYAGEVGVPRLLKLFKKYNMKTTWFIPGEFTI